MHQDTTYTYIKTPGSELQGQEAAACMCLVAYATITMGYLHVADL